MNLSKELQGYIWKFWPKRQASLNEVSKKADSVLQSCSGEERALLEFVLATLPLSDLGDYDPKLLLRFVREALSAREEFPWCAELSEELFLLYVLYPRVNNEELCDCRGVFRQSLAARVRGLPLENAILEVNRWCAEHVTYRSTDGRTSSPMETYLRGFGRCGEESVFAVSALRSVGIAARQVYAPWWSHCDDNHAWVEVWDGRRWRFFGACEPEPELDRGWFPGAASRAMMICARTFLAGTEQDWGFLFPQTEPLDLYDEDGLIYETVTARYAEVKPLTAKVIREDGSPVPNVRVSFSILNMGGFQEIAARKTSADGVTSLRLGKGSVKLSAFSDGYFGEALTSLDAADMVTLTLKPFQGAAQPTDFDFYAPAGKSALPTSLPPEKKKLRAAWLESAATSRKKWIENEKSDTVLSPEEEQVLATLSEKDRAGAPRQAVLEETLPVLSQLGELPKDVFESALLSPRVGLEPLYPWREGLSGAFSREQRQEFARSPRKIWAWMGENVRSENVYPRLCGTPAGCFRLRAGNERTRHVLFCTLCRSLAVPARLSPLDGRPEYFSDGMFRRLDEEPVAILRLTAPKDAGLLPWRNFSLSRYQAGEWHACSLDAPIPAGETVSLALAAGEYRAITVLRLPDGGQLARCWNVSLKAGEEAGLAPTCRKAGTAQMLTSIPLLPFTLVSLEGSAQESASLMCKAKHSVFAWLEPNREPTEHLLNELREAAPGLADCSIHLVLGEKDQRQDPTLQKALAALPNATLWLDADRETASVLARCLFTDPDKLPLVTLADCKGISLYSISGYNVGTGELLVRLLREAQQN